MVRINYAIYLGMQAWFVLQYLISLVIAVGSKHIWRFLAANIAAITTVVAFGASGVKLHASLALNRVGLTRFGIELPYGLEYFPVTLILCFVSVLFLCDAIGREMFGKRLIGKAVVSTIFAAAAVLINTVLFLAFGYVVIAIPYFDGLFLTIFISALLVQFCFTLISSILDVIFAPRLKLRPIYVVLFLIAPVLYIWSAMEFYRSGKLETCVNSIKEFLDPYTFEHLGYFGFAALILVIVWFGRAIVEARYDPNALIHYLSYVLMIMFPAVAFFSTARKTPSCHRKLAAFYSTTSGIVNTVIFTVVVVAITCLPFFVGSKSEYTLWLEEQEKKAEEEEEKQEKEEQESEPQKEKSEAASKSVSKGKGKGKKKVE